MDQLYSEIVRGGYSTSRIPDWRKLIFTFSSLIGSYYLGVSTIPIGWVRASRAILLVRWLW